MQHEPSDDFNRQRCGKNLAACPKLTSDLTVARDFDLGMNRPPLSISMDLLAGVFRNFDGFAPRALTARLCSAFLQDRVRETLLCMLDRGFPSEL